MIKPRKHVQELDLITIVNRTYCFSIIKFMIDLLELSNSRITAV